MFELNNKITIGISSCLLGNKVRYDGGHKHDRYITETLGRYLTFVPVCPEVECGLPIPREAMRLVGDPKNPRLVTRKTNVDVTNRMIGWAKKKTRELAEADLCGFIFKSKSPSSGMQRVKFYSDKGMPRKTGVGIFARIFMEQFPRIPVEEEGRLHDPKLRENFIERIFIYFYRAIDIKKEPGIPVISIAILADDNIDYKPDEYNFRLFGFELKMKIPIIKIIRPDFR